MSLPKSLTAEVLTLVRTQIVLTSLAAWLVALKLDGALGWSWLAVLAPLWGFLGAALLITVIGLVIKAGRAAAK